MACPIGSDAECDLVRCSVLIFGGKTVTLLEDYIDKCMHRDCLVGFACRGYVNAHDYTAELMGVRHIVDKIFVASSPSLFDFYSMRYFYQVVERIRPEIVILDVVTDHLDKLDTVYEIDEFVRYMRELSSILICMGGAKHVIIAAPLYRRHNLECSVEEFVERKLICNDLLKIITREVEAVSYMHFVGLDGTVGKRVGSLINISRHLTTSGSVSFDSIHFQLYLRNLRHFIEFAMARTMKLFDQYLTRFEI